MTENIRNGLYFQEVAEETERKLVKLAELAEQHLELEGSTSDNIKGTMRAAAGQARLIVSKKFPQFYGLCRRNLSPQENEPPVKTEDLEGFWDLTMLEVNSIHKAFHDAAAAANKELPESATNTLPIE